MGNISSALNADIEDFDSIVSVSERLNELANHVEDERLQSQLLALASHPDLQAIASLEVERAEGDRRENPKPPDTPAAPSSTSGSPGNENREAPLPPEFPSPSISASSAAGSRVGAPHPFSPLLPGVLSAVLHATLPPCRTATPPPCLSADPRPRRAPAGQRPATMEQLNTELCDLREDMDLMKSQHNKEIKLLMNELDEEKKIRLSLQMEVQRMKKRMSK